MVVETAVLQPRHMQTASPTSHQGQKRIQTSTGSTMDDGPLQGLETVLWKWGIAEEDEVNVSQKRKMF
jgi:hypothetical protein